MADKETLSRGRPHCRLVHPIIIDLDLHPLTDRGADCLTDWLADRRTDTVTQ
jgi:hypothetical protein